MAVVCALLCAALAVPAPATESFINSTFASDLDGWTWTGWENDSPPEPGSVGTCEWRNNVGWPGGGLHFMGYGVTDGTTNHGREGVYIDKIISTAGKENIRVMFDLYTHLVGVATNNPGDPLLVDHGDLNEQLTIFYTTNGGANWNEIGYMRKTGGNGWEPLETYGAGYLRRVIDLSANATANDNTQFGLRFRYQFNTGCSNPTVGGCPSDGGDWARMDNIIVLGHDIGSGADTTAPGPVTGLTASTQNGFTNTLSWTAPADADYAGAMIRYSTVSYPVSQEDGALLADVWSPDVSFTHAGVPGVTYYYSVFAHDGVPNYATGVTASVTTSTTLWYDSFEPPYTLGLLDLNSQGNWVLTGADANTMISIGNTYANPGSQSATIAHSGGGGSNPHSYVNRVFNYTPANGVAKFHMKLRSPNATDGSTFFYIYLLDPNNVMFARWYGSEASFRPRDGVNNVGTPTFPVASEWYDLDMVVDTVYNKTYCFRNGALVFSGGHTAGDVIGSIRLQDYGPTGDTFTASIVIDDVSIGQGLRPTPLINAPATAGGWVNDTTPTITWTSGTTETVAKYHLKIFTSDVVDPETETPIYNSGEVTSGIASHTVTTALPENTHLWAFVKEHTADNPPYSVGQWLPWSPQGQGGFYVYGGAPPAPTVIAPSGTVIGCKPMIRFTAGEHQSFVVKVTNVSDVEVWNSGEIPGNGTGAACAAMLVPGTQYKAYAQVSNPAGLGAWSAASLFQVTKVGEGTDVKDMSEEGLLTTDVLPPDDMFGKMLNYNDNPNMTLWLEEGMPPSVEVACGNSVMQIIDPNHGFTSRLMRRHRIANIDLNKGITYMFAVAVSGQTGTDGGGARWLQSSAMIVDDPNVSTDRWMVGIKATQNQVGLLTDNATWQLNTSTGDSGYKVIRVTGRNKIYDDFTSTEWKLYVNENSTPAVTATGCMHGPTIDQYYWNRWQCDSVLLGQGSGGLAGTFRYDWTAVNISGDYSPGQWDSLEGGAYPSIGAAKKEDVQQHAAILSNPCVITKVVTHLEWQGDPPEQVPVQDGFFAQDVAGYNNVASGVYVVTSDTKEGAVIEGALLTSLSGVMVEAGVIPVDGMGAYGGRALFDPSFTIEGSAPYPALGLAQKNLIGPCVNQNLGSSFDTTGMLVRVFGKVTLSGWDPNWPNPETPLGAYIIYVDDGSGCDDGRDGVAGIRILVPDDPNFIAPSYGDYVMVEGISAYETISGGSYANVRQILYPQFTIVTSGLP